MKILVVEDEARLAALLARGLGEEGHAVTVAATAAAAAAEVARDESWDVIVLDWGLPDGDGLTLLGRWRRHGLLAPVLMLTARGEVGERVTGLRTGADDYLVKPFDFEELLARVEGLGRRGGSQSDVRRAGVLALHLRNRELCAGTKHVPLTGRELEVMRELIERAGDVVTRAELLSRVWGEAFDGPPNVVDVYVGYLRGKLRELGAPCAITTVRGLGYRLEVGSGS